MLTNNLITVQAKGEFISYYSRKRSCANCCCRNVDKNARSLARLFEVAVSVSKSPPNQRLPSSPNPCALDVVSVQRSALLELLTSSIFRQTSNLTSPIDTPRTASSFIVCLHLDQDRFWVWLDPMVLERVPHSRF